jgi:hypothetical protein
MGAMMPSVFDDEDLPDDYDTPWTAPGKKSLPAPSPLSKCLLCGARQILQLPLDEEKPPFMQCLNSKCLYREPF